MIDSKTKGQTLVSREQYEEAKSDIKYYLIEIRKFMNKIKITRPILVAYALKDTIDYKKYPTYDKWLYNEFLQGIDFEEKDYSMYADMMVDGLQAELDKLEEDANK